jgi:hypothetical protein
LSGVCHGDRAARSDARADAGADARPNPGSHSGSDAGTHSGSDAGTHTRPADADAGSNGIPDPAADAVTDAGANSAADGYARPDGEPHSGAHATASGPRQPGWNDGPADAHASASQPV